MLDQFSVIEEAAASDTRETAARINDLGLFGPSSQAWRLNRESTLLLGAGPRALLMQIAHPLIAEGVAQHSDFRADPWRRLRATLRSYLTIIFGTSAQARAEIGRLNRFHRQVNGPVTDPGAARTFGPRYDARDAQLALWVHATLIDATLVANERWIGRLTRSQRAGFYAETRPIGRAFGIPDALLPVDIEAFDRYLEAMIGPDGPVHVGALARDLAQAILRPPLGSLHPLLARVPAGSYAWTFLPAIELLPASIRSGYGLPWGRREQLIATWLTAGYRAWRPVLPTSLRTMPWARAADSRLGLP